MFDQMKAYVGGDCDVGEYEFVINVIESVEISLACVSGDKETQKIEFSSLDEMERIGKALVKMAELMKNQ